MDALTLPLLEQACTLSALAARRDELPVEEPERLLLDGLIVRIGSHSPEVVLEQLDVFVMLRYVRLARLRLGDEMRALEERRRLGVNGRLDAEWRAFDAEAQCLDNVLRKLWQLMP